MVGYGMLIFWILIIMFLLSNSVEEFGNALTTIADNKQTIANAYVEKIEQYMPGLINRIATEERITQLEIYLFGLLSDTFSKLSTIVINSLLIIPLMFYMYFKRKKKILRNIVDLVPKKFHNGFQRGIKDIGDQLHEYFTAKVVESSVVGAICCLGFFVAGVQGWLILGLLAGFLNVVPFVGPILGAIPPIVIALLLDEPIVALYVVITITIAQIIDNFYLIPFMVSNKVQIDPLLIIILILVGAQMIGILGMIFAIPIYLVYKIVLRESYSELVKIYRGKS